jgi:hypothetical protein
MENTFVKDFIQSLKNDDSAKCSLAMEAILMGIHAHLFQNTDLMNSSIRTIAMNIANSWGTTKQDL